MRSASAIKPQSAAQQAALAKPGALKAAPAKAAVTVLPPKLRRAAAHGSARAQAVSAASHDSAELMQASHSAVKDTPANHAQAGPVPPPRRAAASDEAIAVPAALRAPLVAIVGTRAVDSARLHIGPHASARASQSQARALAEGDDIFFGAGQYRPGTCEGDALIAHEIAHVDQAQRGLLHGPARKAMSGEAQGPLEAAADQAADQLTAGANLDEQQKARREAGKKPALVLVSPASAEAGLDGATPKAAPAQAAGQGKGKPGDAVEGEAGQGAPKPALATAPGEAAAPIVSKAKLPPDLPVMPEPAVSLSPAEASRAGGVQARAKASATAAASAPLATDNVAAAKAAVQVPQSENDARAAEKIVADLAASVKPSPEIVALCDRIKKLIREKRPADEDGVIDTRPQEVAQVAGATVEGDVQKNVDDTKSSYGPMSATPAGTPSVAPPDVAPLPGAAPAPELKAAAATPDAVPPAQVNLNDDAKRMEAKAVDAGLDGDAAQLVDGGPVGDARDARGEMKTLSKKGPAEALAEQKSALAKSDEEIGRASCRERV